MSTPSDDVAGAVAVTDRLPENEAESRLKSPTEAATRLVLVNSRVGTDAHRPTNFHDNVRRTQGQLARGLSDAQDHGGPFDTRSRPV